MIVVKTLVISIAEARKLLATRMAKSLANNPVELAEMLLAGSAPNYSCHSIERLEMGFVDSDIARELAAEHGVEAIAIEVGDPEKAAMPFDKLSVVHVDDIADQENYCSSCRGLHWGPCQAEHPEEGRGPGHVTGNV